MMLNFFFEGSVVLVVVFVQNVYKVQSYLVAKYYLVDQYSSCYFIDYYKFIDFDSNNLCLLNSVVDFL